MAAGRGIRSLLDRLWEDYARLNPQARRIHELLAARGERIRNDHVALRTFDVAPVGLDALVRTFVRAGYRPAGRYRFEEKKLRARHWEPPGEDLPLLFASELEVGKLPDEAQEIVRRLVSQVPPDLPAREHFAVSGRPWSVTRGEYERLRSESEYAAWLAAFGFRANHFTVSVNDLSTFDGLDALNRFLEEAGFSLNAVGGAIKGSPSVHLEQSSTLADEADVDFADGRLRIPACYYEFARRYRLPDGTPFRGFVERSADGIFESTDRR